MFVIQPSPGMNSQASTHIILFKKATVISEYPKFNKESQQPAGL